MVVRQEVFQGIPQAGQGQSLPPVGRQQGGPRQRAAVSRTDRGLTPRGPPLHLGEFGTEEPLHQDPRGGQDQRAADHDTLVFDQVPVGRQGVEQPRHGGVVNRHWGRIAGALETVADSRV